jgi:hypothetical protein
MMPLSSWLASMIAPSRRDTPMPWLPIWTGTRSPLSAVTTAPMGSEYLVPKKKICPTSIAREDLRRASGMALKIASSWVSSVRA